jgi:tetratricopeptide (TPR) repeat protein
VNQRSFEIHRLVQISVVKWLEVRNELEVWKTTSVQPLAKTFPSGDFENWSMCKKLLPHAKKVLESSSGNETDLGLARLANNIGWYMRSKGQYNESESLHRRALKTTEKVLGAKHRSTLASANNLASVLQDQGKYGEAEALGRRALNAYERVLGAEHPDTLISVYSLAYLLHQQQKYAVAQPLYERALRSFEKVLEPTHPTTIACSENYSSLLQDLNELEGG